MDPVVQFDRVTKDYASLRALDEISLSIGPGVTGLLGPNGAGKTTLIKVLLGLVRVNSGTGQILGHPLGTDVRAIRECVGLMPEDDCYIPGLTGIEQLQFMARLSGQPATEGLRRSHEILDYCHVGQERYRDVGTYSTGMRQKLKFAQAIVHDPPLLILDEPTAGLDPEERVALLDRIRSLARDAGKFILVSTHILPDVQTICDTVVILVAGKIRLQERVDVLAQPALPLWQVRGLGNIAALQARVEQEGLQADTDHLGRLSIRGIDEDRIDQVWLWAEECGVCIQTLTAGRNSLEDIFLSVIQEQHVADS